jgi:CRP-like cAMP-binding protein
MAFATIVILFGGLFLPAIVGGLAAYVEGLHQAERTHALKSAKGFKYLKKRTADRGLADQVLHYYDYIWSRQKGAGDSLDALPGPLQQSVASHLNGETIRSVPFFSGCDDNLFQCIVALLVPRIYIPDDNITVQGKSGREMFFIEHGSVVACSANRETIYNILGCGNYFGESALLASSSSYTATTYALTYCDCFVLSRASFQAALNTFPGEQRHSILREAANALKMTEVVIKNIRQNFALRKKCRTLAGGSDLKNKLQKGTQRIARFDPDHPFRHCWNALMIGAIGYNAWMIPLRLAFLAAFPSFLVDWCSDVALLVDIYLNTFEFSHRMDGELVSDVKKIKAKYLEKEFLFDVISIIPFELIPLLLVEDAGACAILVALFRMPKLLGLRRLLKLLQDLLSAFEQINVQMGPLKLAQLLGVIILIAHWAGCGFYALAVWYTREGNCDASTISDELESWGTSYSECLYSDTWLQSQIENGKLPFDGGGVWDRYIRAFNWALPTLVVVVIGDVSKCFEVFCFKYRDLNFCL